MTDSSASLVVGDTVMGRWKNGNWYAAELLKVGDDRVQVQWFDDGRRARLNRDEVEAIPNRGQTKHQHELGDKIIAEFDGVWCSGTVSGLFDVGYYVVWDNEAETTRILEGQALFFPTGMATVGSKALALYNPGEWYVAAVKSVFSNSVEILWEDGGGIDNLPYDHVIPLPAIATNSPPSNDGLTHDMQHFRSYFEARVRAGEISSDQSPDDQYCPNCKTRHLVNWFTDKTYDIRFFACNVAVPSGVVVLPIETDGLAVLTIDQLLTKYPAVPRPQGSLLRKIFGATEVVMSPFPPFVTLTFGGKGR